MSDRERLYRYRAITPQGAKIAGVVEAKDEVQAFARASRQGLTVTRLQAMPSGQLEPVDAISRIQQIALLRQLGAMIEARVEAAQAFSALEASAPSRAVSDAMGKALVELRSGSPLGQCLALGIPGLPASTLALVNAGEAGGCLAATLTQAVEQLEAEDRIVRAVKSALIYPAFLIVAGLVAAFVMLLFVIPRFAEIIGERREQLDGMSRMVFWLGDLAQNSLGLALLLPVLALIAIGTVLSQQGYAATLGALAKHVPILRRVAELRNRERWCRILAFALNARIGLVEALGLASAALSDAGMQELARVAAKELRYGSRVADAIAKLGLLDETQLSMVRVGEETGSIPEMLEKIAVDTERNLHESLKRLTLVIEQMVIVGVSIFVGLIVYGLISSLTSVYETIGQ